MGTSFRRVGFALALTLALASSASAAQAQTDGAQGDDRARLHFQSGAAYYDAGEYESALREFESAFELSHRAQLYYNMYLCEQAIGNLENAASHLEHFLTEVAEVENRPTLELRLTNLRERIAHRAAGGVDPGPTLEETEQASAHAILADGESQPAPMPEPPPERGPNVPAIASFSVAALGVVGAVIFGPLTLAEDSSLSSSACGMARSCTDAQTSTLSTYALMTDISLTVALVGAAVGTVLLFVVGDDASGEQALTVTPLAGPTLAGLMIGGSL